MAVNLIKENGVVHDYAMKMFWGHNIEGNDEDFDVVKFESLETRAYDWTAFEYIPIYAGDFIIRNMVSGQVGLYEVTSSIRWEDPNDAYKVRAVFCGYYDKVTQVKTIFSGYGVYPPAPPTLYERFMRWFDGFCSGSLSDKDK